MNEETSLEALRQQVLDGLKQGKPMFGKDGAFAPLIENILNTAERADNPITNNTPRNPLIGETKQKAKFEIRQRKNTTTIYFFISVLIYFFVILVAFCFSVHSL